MVTQKTDPYQKIEKITEINVESRRKIQHLIRSDKSVIDDLVNQAIINVAEILRGACSRNPPESRRDLPAIGEIRNSNAYTRIIENFMRENGIMNNSCTSAYILYVLTKTGEALGDQICGYKKFSKSAKVENDTNNCI